MSSAMSNYKFIRPHFVHYHAYTVIKQCSFEILPVCMYSPTFETNCNAHKALMQIDLSSISVR